jgi:DNA-binding NarL/FixJ family response regulator
VDTGHRPQVTRRAHRPLDTVRRRFLDTGRMVNRPIRILLVDDQPSIRRGLRMRLGLEPDIDVVAEADNGTAALEAACEFVPDVVLMDIEMPSMDGITATSRIAECAPACMVVMLSLHDDVDTRERAKAAGAISFVAKHEIDHALTDAIRAAAQQHRAAEQDSGAG